jgi:peptidoglycan/xylan/chitin deacetylase (PgdA/CDA1 family)
VRALLALRKRAETPWITALTYHRAGRPEDVGPWDDGVVDVTPEVFDRQLAFLGEWCTVIGFDDLVAFSKGKALPRNPVLLTFDDGYLDNYEVVLPLLRKHGMKAMFFIATSYIEERRLFWWDRINYVMKSTSKDVIELDYPTPLRLDVSASARKRSINTVLRTVKDHFGLDLERYLEHLSERAGVVLSRDEERRLADSLLMTWDHVRRLHAAGMDVQSHTSTHRVLQTLSDADLDRELGASREVLEGILRAKVDAISYPVGKPLRFNPHIRNAVRRSGYSFGFSNRTGVNHVWNLDPIDTHRIAVDVELSDAYFRAMIAVPYLGY